MFAILFCQNLVSGIDNLRYFVTGFLSVHPKSHLFVEKIIASSHAYYYYLREWCYSVMPASRFVCLVSDALDRDSGCQCPVTCWPAGPRRRVRAGGTVP